VGVIHALEIVEVEQEHGAVAALTGEACMGLGESVLEQRSIREPRERIVQRLV
jgi:hypothetical protein